MGATGRSPCFRGWQYWCVLIFIPLYENSIGALPQKVIKFPLCAKASSSSLTRKHKCGQRAGGGNGKNQRSQWGTKEKTGTLKNCNLSKQRGLNKTRGAWTWVFWLLAPWSRVTCFPQKKMICMSSDPFSLSFSTGSQRQQGPPWVTGWRWH